MAGAEAKRQEERVKLLASALSNIGVAVIIAGFVSPVLGERFHPDAALTALIVGMLLHLGAQLLLHYVVETPRSFPPREEAEPEMEP